MALNFQVDEATAAQRRFPLYLVDATDGITPETGEAAGQPQVSENGAAFVNTSATLTAIGNGSYYVELTAAELSTLGMLTIRYKSAATAEFSLTGQVVSFDPYDATPPVDVTTWDGTAVATPNTAGVPLMDLVRIVGGLVPTPTTTGVPDVNVERWLDTLVTLGAGAPDVNVQSMDAASIASGVIAAAELTNIENEIWDALKSAHVVANSFGDFVDIEVSSRMAETSINTTGGAIDVVTAITNAVTVGTINAGVITAAAIATGAIDADALAADVRAEIIGALGVEGVADAGGSTSTIRDAALTQVDDFFNGHYILLTSGTNNGRIVRVTDFDATLDDITFAPTVGAAVGAGDTYIILGSAFSQVDVQTWFNAVVNALVSGAVDADVSNIQANAVDAAAIATNAVDADALATDAVDEIVDQTWDELIAGHVGVGSFGEEVQAHAQTGDAMDLVANAVDATAIATDAIDADAIAANAIGSSEIATGAIDADAIAADAIGASEIATDAIGSDELATTAIQEISRAINPQVNNAFDDITFLMVDSTNHNPSAGLTVSGERSLNGGAFGAVTGSIAEISDGIYQLDASAADMNGAMIIFRFFEAASDDTLYIVKTAA